MSAPAPAPRVSCHARNFRDAPSVAYERPAGGTLCLAGGDADGVRDLPISAFNEDGDMGVGLKLLVVAR